MLFSIPGILPPKINAGQELRLQEPLNVLQIGKVLRAVVISPISNNTLTLDIGGKQLSARTNHAFAQGEVLQVKVTQAGKDVVLNVQQRATSSELINQALKQVLPTQKPPIHTLSNLNQLLQLPPNQLNQLPPVFVQQVRQLIQSLPSEQQLTTASGLKNAIAQSGNFLESSLSTNTNTKNLGGDFKAQLLKVLQSLDTKPQQSATAPAPAPGPKGEMSVKQMTEMVLGRNTTPSAPVINTQALQQAGLAKQAQAHITQRHAASTPTNQTTAGNEKTQSATTEGSFKHLPLPIKGAIPQAIKMQHSQPLPLDNNERMLAVVKEQVNQSLTRVQANQLSSIPRDNQATTHFLVDVPFKIDDKIAVIPLLIEEEEQSADNEQEEAQNAFAITLALHLDALGDIQIRASQINDEVSIQLWATDGETFELLQLKNPILEGQLLEEKVKLAKLDYHHGQKENQINPRDANILDIKA